MGATERRNAIMQALGRRRYDKISNLASEFGVSERTIRRDIEILSLTEPIRTEAGRYSGGVYVLDSYYKSKKYLNSSQISALQKVLYYSNHMGAAFLSAEDVEALQDILTDFTKPTNNK